VTFAEKVLINSFPEFDQLANFDFMKDSVEKFVSIGPLGMKRYSRDNEKKSEALQFLDLFPAKSVLYIAFGSEFRIKNEEVVQIVKALIQMDVPCIWSVRESQIEYIPDDFSNSSKRLILKWAPQIDILNHPSTRCFLSHCGWNSCLESLQAGISMICWPIFAEQFLNSLLLIEKGVGVLVQGTGLFASKIVQSEEIANLFAELFNDDTFAFYQQAASFFKKILDK
jgi:UDP:flavonoid glycosyltransferase YjiC (YdhE family)